MGKIQKQAVSVEREAFQVSEPLSELGKWEKDGSDTGIISDKMRPW